MSAAPIQAVNQYLPVVPWDSIAHWIITYWCQKKTDEEILQALRTHYIDTTTWGLGFSTYRRYRWELGLLGARQQDLKVKDVRQNMQRLCLACPRAGSKEMISIYFQAYCQKVTRSVMTTYFNIYEPALADKRKAGRLRRKQFYAAGVNDLWCFDQHDKWKYRFKLCLHVCVEPFLGYIVWLRIWWNSSNPCLIVTYYLDAVRALSAIPLLTQSNAGTKNVWITQSQTYLWHRHDPQLPPHSIQHQYKEKTIKGEIEWSQLRQRWSPGFEDHMEEGVRLGLYNTLNPLHVLVFHWVFIPWLQDKLSCYKERVNAKLKCRNKDKLTPHACPVDLFYRPKEYGVCNFSVKLDRKALEEAQACFVPEGHPVLKLVPDSFQAIIEPIWESMGCPVTTRKNTWGIYSLLLAEIIAFRDSTAISPTTLDEWNNACNCQTWKDKDAEDCQDSLESGELKHGLGLYQFEDAVSDNKAMDMLEGAFPVYAEAEVTDDKDDSVEDWFGAPLFIE